MSPILFVIILKTLLQRTHTRNYCVSGTAPAEKPFRTPNHSNTLIKVSHNPHHTTYNLHIYKYWAMLSNGKAKQLFTVHIHLARLQWPQSCHAAGQTAAARGSHARPHEAFTEQTRAFSPLLAGASLDGQADKSQTAEPTVSGEYRGACIPCPSCHWWDLVSANTRETQFHHLISASASNANFV